MSVKAKSEGYLLEDLADGMKPDEWVCLQAVPFQLAHNAPQGKHTRPRIVPGFSAKTSSAYSRRAHSRFPSLNVQRIDIHVVRFRGRKTLHTQYYTYLAVHSVNILHPLIFLYCITNRERSPEAYRQHRSFTFSSRVTWTLAMCLLNKDISSTKNEKQ